MLYKHDKRDGGHDAAASAAYREYLEAVVAGDSDKAAQVIENTLSTKTDLVTVYDEIVIRVQREVGKLWADGELSIASENIATGISWQTLERLRSVGNRKPALGATALVAMAPGEQHSFGARIVADFLYLDGWDVDFLGSRIPQEEIVGLVARKAHDLVALAAILPENNEGIARLVSGVRKANPGAAVLLGGPGVGSHENALQLGGDSFAADATGAVAEARRLLGVPDGMTLDQILTDLGKTIEKYRKERRLSQGLLAEAAGIDRTYISAVENGKQNLTLAALAKIAGALGVRVTDLLSES